MSRKCTECGELKRLDQYPVRGGYRQRVCRTCKGRKVSIYKECVRNRKYTKLLSWPAP